MAVVDLIREQVEICESQGVEILCCPEGVLGGLADYVGRPSEIAINVNNVYVVRADVAGRVKNSVSYGSTGIVDPDGKVLVEAKQLEPCLIVADISLGPQQRAPVHPGEQRGYASP
jgi:predicted amidohydrolase